MWFHLQGHQKLKQIHVHDCVFLWIMQSGLYSLCTSVHLITQLMVLLGVLADFRCMGMIEHIMFPSCFCLVGFILCTSTCVQLGAALSPVIMWGNWPKGRCQKPEGTKILQKKNSKILASVSGWLKGGSKRRKDDMWQSLWSHIMW